MNSEKKNKGIIVFLLLLILVIGYLSYKNTQDYKRLQNVFEEEKNEIKNELDKIIVNYDEAINRRITLTVNLEKKRNALLALRDSVKKLEKNNFYLISKFRKQVSQLEAENKRLFSAIASLSEEKRQLQTENSLTKKELEEQGNITQDLMEKNKGLKSFNESLEEKVAKASQIKISDLHVSTLKLKTNKKYTETTKSKKVDAFRSSFVVLENEVLEPGELKIYVNILDKDLNCISPIGELQVNGKGTISYSDVLTIDYKNKKETIISLVEIKRGEIKEGDYQINIFSDSKTLDFKLISVY